MQIRTLSTLALAAAIGALTLAGSQALSQEKPPKAEKKPFSADYRDHDPGEAMQRWMQTMQAGPQHAALAKFIGEWETKTTYKMPGTEGMPPIPGTAKTRWLFEGKWLISESKSSLMGQPMDMVTITGYDNFKRKYVTVLINSLETEVRTMMGNYTEDGKALFQFGTMNEAMTGEVEKPFSSVTRVKSDDEHVIEVHDPSIGDSNTQVMTFVYTRKKK